MTILCGRCWNIDSRKIIWRPRAHFGSENESLKGLTFKELIFHRQLFILYEAEQHNKLGWSCIGITVDHLNANAREMVLVKGPCSPLSGVVIWLGGFHLLFSSMGSTGTMVVGNGTDALSIIMHVHSSFERDNKHRTVLFTYNE